jgi:hypothetical protein
LCLTVADSIHISGQVNHSICLKETLQQAARLLRGKRKVA